MPNQQYQEEKIKIVAVGDLGPGNQGELGPASEDELEAARDLDEERYWGTRQEKSACMDDRLEGLRLHLAGNRAITETAAEYLDRFAQPSALSQTMARKVNQLVVMGRIPVFHEKCAALASIRAALIYAAENEDAVVEQVWQKLDQIGATEFLTEQQLRTAIKTGLGRSQEEELWDTAPERLMEIAQENGAEVESTPGDHKVAVNLDNMSRLGFNNGLFREDHPGDDGEPMGALTIDWTGYRDQLLEDGYSEKDAARMSMLAGIFIVSVQKMINGDGSPVVTVGASA
jgi:hypothetical protein